MSDRLIRVTAVAGGRRSDLAVPGEVAVAELVPDLARAVGLLDPAAVYAGYRLHVHGRRLRPDRGLREQGVDDGALLAVAAGADSPEPPTYDDLAEATANAVERQRAWQPADTRRTTNAAGAVAVAAGLGTLVWTQAALPSAVWSVALVLVVLAGNVLPTVAVAGGVARAEGAPIDTDRVATMVERSRRLLLAGSVAVAAVTVLAVPVVADGVAGCALAADCSLVLLLRARRARSLAQVLVDAVGGLVGLLAIAGSVLLRHPDTRLTVAASLAAGGAVLCALTRLPPAPTVLRARVVDLVEIVALVGLAPLLLLATAGPARVPGT